MPGFRAHDPGACPGRRGRIMADYSHRDPHLDPDEPACLSRNGLQYRSNDSIPSNRDALHHHGRTWGDNASLHPGRALPLLPAALSP
jgi:hypothetical protein